MDWNEIRAHLLGHFEVVRDEGRWLVLQRRFPEGDREITQRVELSTEDLQGRPWLTLWADVCPAEQLPAMRALSRNARLAVGSVAIEGGAYYLRHTVPLGALGADDLRLIVELVAHEAARLRTRERTAPAETTLTHLFSGYAEGRAQAGAWPAP